MVTITSDETVSKIDDTDRHKDWSGRCGATAPRAAARNSQRIGEIVGRCFRDEDMRRGGRLLLQLLLLLRDEDAGSALSNDAVEYCLLSLHR